MTAFYFLIIGRMSFLYWGGGGGEDGHAEVYGVSVHYLLTYEETYNRFNLPYYSFLGFPESFSKMLWYNSDYPLYIVRKRYPEYSFYWLIENDVYYNASDYSLFLDEYLFSKNELMWNFGKSSGRWYWDNFADWIYQWSDRYRCLFAIIRLSGKAIDYLYSRRLSIGDKFKEFVQSGNKDKRYPFCELFVPSELMLYNYQCECLHMHNHKVGYCPETTADFYTQKRFEHFDNTLYHPIKDSSFLYTIQDKTGLKWL